MTTKPQRKKRFERDPSVRLRVTERDLSVMHEVYKYRFLTSEQIIRLFGGSRKGLLRRLNLLYHAGYLDRPQAQLAWLGNHPMAYGLGNKGAEVLAYQLDVPAASVDWTTKNREVKGVFLEHTLMVSQFLIAVRLACKRDKGVRFIEPDAIIHRRPTVADGSSRGLSWRVEVSKDYTIHKKNAAFSVNPDGAFGLRFHENGQDKGIAYFFVEADRSTMPIRRSNLGRSSFYKKMVGYWDSWRQGLFSSEFGFKSPRVLTLTISPERIKTMLAVNKDMDPRGQGLRMFLFAPEAISDIGKPETVFSRSWQNGRGELVSIVD